MTILANRTLQSTVRRLQGTNVIQPLLAGGGHKRGRTLCITSKEGRRSFLSLGFSSVAFCP